METCIHVYETVEGKICSHCGKDTHNTDWEFIAETRRKHREEKGLFYTVREWWSI